MNCKFIVRGNLGKEQSQDLIQSRAVTEPISNCLPRGPECFLVWPRSLPPLVERSLQNKHSEKGAEYDTIWFKSQGFLSEDMS